MTLLALVAWSVWYVTERLWPAECRSDGCSEQDGPGHAALRFGMWVSALAFATLSVVLTRRTLQATALRVASATALAVACFAIVVVTLGGLFPPATPPIYGY